MLLISNRGLSESKTVTTPFVTAVYREQVRSKARHDECGGIYGGFATVAVFDSAMHSACANSFKHVVDSRKDLVGLVEGLLIHHVVLQARYEERVQEVLERPTVHHHGDGRYVERVIRALQGRRRQHEGRPEASEEVDMDVFVLTPCSLRGAKLDGRRPGR